MVLRSVELMFLWTCQLVLTGSEHCLCIRKRAHQSLWDNGVVCEFSAPVAKSHALERQHLRVLGAECSEWTVSCTDLGTQTRTRD